MRGLADLIETRDESTGETLEGNDFEESGRYVENDGGYGEPRTVRQQALPAVFARFRSSDPDTVAAAYAAMQCSEITARAAFIAGDHIALSDVPGRTELLRAEWFVNRDANDGRNAAEVWQSIAREHRDECRARSFVPFFYIDAKW